MIFFLVWTEWQETFLVELIRYHKTVAKVTYQKIALEYSDTSAASYGIIYLSTRPCAYCLPPHVFPSNQLYLLLWKNLINSIT